MSTFDTFANDSLVTVPAAPLAVAKAACYRTARVAVARGWTPGELREVLGALGLIDTPQLPSGGFHACPSQQSRGRHIRAGVDCRKCWPNGRRMVTE